MFAGGDGGCQSNGLVTAHRTLAHRLQSPELEMSADANQRISVRGWRHAGSQTAASSNAWRITRGSSVIIMWPEDGSSITLTPVDRTMASAIDRPDFAGVILSSLPMTTRASQCSDAARTAASL